ncbi:MAG: TetR family transcriptional regulator [Pseudomonadota bacterium]
MEEQRIRILEATIEVVSRYGVAKTSVGDIAKAAGLSRQTIYSLLKNRTAILRAAIEYSGEKTDGLARDMLSRAPDLASQLDTIFSVYTVQVYELMHAQNEVLDISSGAEEFAADVLEANHARHSALIARVLRPFAKELKENDLTPTLLASQVEAACRGYKSSAGSVAQLKRLLAAQKKLVLLAVGSPQ